MPSLISSAFGSITTWVIIGMSVIILGMTEYIHIVNADIKVCEAQKRSAIHDLDLQSLVIESNKAEYTIRLAEVAASKKTVEIERQTKIEIVEKWRTKYVENNATCSDATTYLNNYNY